MYCQISLLKPKPSRKARMSETFGTVIPVALKTKDRDILISDYRFNQKKSYIQCSCDTQAQQDLLAFCKNLHLSLNHTPVQLITLTPGKKHSRYMVVNFRKGKGKITEIGACSHDWTIRNLIELQILESQMD